MTARSRDGRQAGPAERNERSVVRASGTIAQLAIRGSGVGRLIAQGRHREAEEQIRLQLLPTRPHDPRVLDALGLCLHFQDRYPEAIDAFHRSISSDPKRARAWWSLGNALSAAGRPGEAVEAYRSCLALAPDDRAAQYNLALTLLQLGQWEEGWRLYDRRARLTSPSFVPPGLERWSGERPGRYILLLKTEQGIGDTIQFCRFAGRLRQAGYDTMVWTEKRLAPLLRCVADIGPVLYGAKLQVHGRPAKWCPLMSVPHALRVTPETVPPPPMLAVERARAERWRARIGEHGLKVGICWQGNPKHGSDRQRSLPLAALQPLAEIAGVRLIALQKRPGAEQIARVAFRDRVETVEDDAQHGESLLDLAAIMMCLDVVVTVDTMAAHLAGTLYRPVWTALHSVPDWRWMIGRADTPWYPTMRLFRQPAPGDWRAVARAMAAELSRLALLRGAGG